MNYTVHFIKMPDKNKSDSKEEYIGYVHIDDVGVSKNHTLASKAWRQAPSFCLSADKVIIERI